MPMREINDVERLKRINAALVSRVERSMDQQGNAFSLFQTAINLESQVRMRTEELRSTLRRLEESNQHLVAAKDAAEQANLSKTRFLAAASHDVLQPLNAAHLSVSALADLQTSEEGTRLVRQVERSLTTMENLLQTLLDISKLDAGVVTPDITDVSLEQLFSSIKSDFQPLAAQKGLSFRFRSGNAVVRSDRTMLWRILQNIVSNAMRYTRRGGVLVGARPRGPIIRVEVYDTGCGIAENQRERVFEEFHRGAPAIESDPTGSGLGLGLSIVRRMADALGHPIGFRSDVGRGTVFRLDIPASSTTAVELARPDAEPSHTRGYGLFGTRVLLVENDLTLLRAMVSLLERWRCSVRSATSSKQALARLGVDGWTPDVVIADQHLDGGDLGTTTVAAVRERLSRPVPSLLVTGDASPQLVESARAAGIELMRKPVKPAQLRALLAHLLA
jgi:signal transduction histidine kinase